MSRRKAREVAFKVVFQVDQVDAEPREAFNYLVAESSLPPKDQGFAWDLIQGCIANLTEIDKRIASFSKEWSVDRMSSVDRNVMRIASCEMLFLPDAQPVVAIDEAIEICKRYSEDNSSSFVNAILDKVLGETK